MLSIIIPTLNEEKDLPLLLDSILKQELVEDYEIIVADAGSTDKTIEVAKNYGCRIVSGGLPAKGRNEGANVARGNLLLFTDGDTMFAEKSLGILLKEFNKRNLDVATFLLRPFGENKWLNISYDFCYNRLVIILENVFPISSGTIIIKRDLHQKIGGFDEGIRLAEDGVYVRQAAKYGNFGTLKSSKIFYSQRRFEKEGWIKSYLKIFLANIYMIFFGPIRSDIFKYRFEDYKKKR